MNIYAEIKKLETYEKENDRAEKMMIENPDNEEFETAFDETYKKAWEQAEKIIKRLVEKLGIDSKTARVMLYGKRDKITQLASAYNGEF